ncbi:uncharacterized protein LOC132552648 [Ylistrum balloti]|uniref:uncharacterized protein LOC132552648 n=1 Tax=Ylistrum balloti TaxID=509963 RepID=UPI002905AE16|nr:uncharacterized protein LOC132552648 [Ylistrum balloti]
MLNRLSVTLLRPTVRSPVVRKFGGQSAYEKVFSRDSLLHPLNGVKHKELTTVTCITGLAVTAAIAYPLYYLFANIDISINKNRPYPWQDARPGHRDVLIGRRKYGDLHDDIKKMTGLLENTNDEKLIRLEDKVEKIRQKKLKAE